ncbi:MAG TPA: glucodextranase DOMON-like domain-containing protein [Thermoanaerobaculia bacterium]|nr:glucodextranase DOMON-like domain-containing protein [Thermoanaerobaculia bacterium]
MSASRLFLRRLATGLVSSLIALLVAGTAAAAKDHIFELTDPRGDDHGDGSLRYPLRYYGMAPGDLDLTSFSARAVAGGTEFEVGFANPVRATGRRTIDIGGTNLDAIARFGFYTVNVDLYIDTDRKPGSGATNTLPGRRAEIDPAFAWERAVALTPRPFDAKTTLKRILLRSLKDELRAKDGSLTRDQADLIQTTLPGDLESHIFFPNRIKASGRTIKFFVSEGFLGGVASADWAYTVVVTGCDIDQRFDLGDKLPVRGADNLFILPVAPGGNEDKLGGGQEDDELQPPIMDLLVPAGFTQEKILRDYDLGKGRPVRLPGVVPAAKK